MRPSVGSVSGENFTALRGAAPALSGSKPSVTDEWGRAHPPRSTEPGRPAVGYANACWCPVEVFPRETYSPDKS